ncbi:MAG: DNA-binding protein [Deltaproteobacteria bacterium]|jgi:NAD-dependent SIR2 family protein deacetylase|nr:DNA-binding protein [Deltaproteobacteria bacterium]
MDRKIPDIDITGWHCHKCQQPLTMVSVKVTYMGASFDVELPSCAKCGTTMIPEFLAFGKMLDVEKLLEDK